MLVSYGELFDEKRNQLADEIIAIHSDMDMREAQTKARLILLTEMSDKAYKRPKRSREHLLELFKNSGKIENKRKG